MKKVFLTLTMLLFAFMGTMRADEVTIGSLDGAGNNSYLPMNSLYEYSFSEQIYTADEIGTAGTINELTMWLYGNENLYTMPFDIYMVEVDKDAFANTSDWVTVTAADKVYEGEVTVHNTDAQAYTFTLDTPFNYAGTGNLVIAFLNKTGQWKSGLNGKVFGASGDPVRAIYARRDSTPYDIANLPAATSTTYQRNVVTLDMTAGGGTSVTVEIGSLDGAANNSYLPMNSLYEYSFSEQIYTAEEIGNAGTINAFTMWLYGNENLYTMPFDIYMVEVDKDAFANTSDWVTVTAADKVYEGEVTVHNTDAQAYTFTLDTPFNYAGTGNLVIAFLNKTGQWKSGLNGKVFGASGDPVRAIYARRDSTPYDITNLPAANSTTYQKNVIAIDMVVSGTPTPPAPVVVDIITDPVDLNIGARPIGYWMEPYTFEFKTDRGSATINQMINGSNAFMTVNLETPAIVLDTVGTEATVTTGTAEPGTYTEQFAIDFTGNRTLKSFEITGTAYEPVEGDVWELAIENPTLPFNGNAPAGIYKNYNIENSTPDAADVIYKVTFDNDVILSAGTTSANGVARLYKEDFDGQPGPMEDNYYVYGTGGTNYPPVDTWFGGYEYTGSTTFFGTSSGGGMIYGYKVPASLLSGYGHCYLTTVEAAAREAYPYNLYVLRGGTSPADATLVYYQEMPTAATALYFFDMEITTPFEIGETEDLWVLFYSESPYAAYCGKVPVDAENGKIWYTLDGTTWYSSESYTPVIYLHLQYPNPTPAKSGEVVLNLADMSIKPINNNGTVGEAKGHVNMPVHHSASAPQQRDGYPMIYNQFVPAGTYYLAVASTVDAFDVYIQTDEAPAPVQATINTPADGDQGINNGDMFQWTLGDYTQEFQIILGTQFPPTDVYVDWTNDLFQSMPFTGLQHNKTYFAQINERNSTGTTYGEIIGFTTTIDGVENFAVESENLYPGENAVFTWDANTRTLQGYNLYQDGVKLNDEPITATTYTVEDLAYNMTGYSFQISALYDEGESALSEPIVVKMTGNGTVKGRVFEQDGVHKVADATVEIRGIDEYGFEQVFTTTTGSNGRYTVSVLAGTNYRAYAYKDGYQECAGEDIFNLAYRETVTDINVLLYETYNALGQITATEQPEENNVLVEWSWTPAELIIDFETGDFSQANFTLPATYPWEVTTTNPYEGTYCMKSTCEGAASASSIIEATVDVPYDGLMGFYVRVSSESNYDKFHFYIDGVEQGSAMSGQLAYQYKEYAVTEGTHTYKWEYTKDSSVNSNDDCVYVDNITMYKLPAPPIPGATTYDFESGMQGWTSLDANNDGYGWVLGSAAGGVYLVTGASLAGTGHNASQDMVCSGSYSNYTQAAITPDNYLVSPAQISIGSGDALISFYACAQDGSYAAEHFGVAVSTTTATAAAFTTIQEWTMTAKGAQGKSSDDRYDVRGTTAQGNWYQFTTDLSAYAGQDIWVAIRHFNCNDQFILNVDDIMVADGSAKREVAENDRSFQHFNLYRRNNNVGEDETPVATQIAQPASNIFSYEDEDWATLPYGIYQWGIQAYYEGNRGSRDEVVIGEGATTNSYVPTYTYYNYSLTEQIYTAAEIGTAGEISSVAFYNTQDNRTRNIALYMAATDKEAFADGYDWVNFIPANKVFEGEVTFTSNDWTVITFTTPFVYDGTSNIIIGMDDNTGSYQSSVGFKADNTTAEMALRIYNDYTNFDPSTATTYSGTTMTVKNQIKLEITATSGGAGTGLSEILWSNEIEKDMYSNVTVNVTLNNGQAPVGVNVAFDDVTDVTNEEGTVVFEDLRKGDYTLSVTMEGFNSHIEAVSIVENEMVFDITLTENVGPVEELYVSPTGWAKWKGGEAGGTTPVPPVGPTTTWSDDFEDGALTNWTTIDADGDGDTWQNATPATYGIGDAHSGTNCASSWSWNSYSMDPDNYMISPMCENATNIHYFVATNTGYPDHYGIFASSTGTNASDFTLVFEETAGSKGNPGVKSSMTQAGTRDMSAWMDKTVDLPAGTKYVAFRHWNSYDMNYLFVDDVTITMGGSKAERAALSYKVMLDGAYVGETPYPYYQHDVEGMAEGSEHVTSVAAIYATGMGDWVDYTWTYTACDNFNGATNVAAAQNGTDVTITWEMPNGTGPVPPTPGEGQWYYYDDGTNEDAIGTGGGNFWWGVMFPAGSYTGNMVTKVAAYDYMAMTGTVTIYNDGATSPATAVGTANVTLTGSEDFVEVEFADPITIDPTKNLWVVYYNGSSATYPAAVCANTGDANGRWVSLDGSSWADLASYGLDYTFMVRAYVAQGAKGAVTEISVPQYPAGTGMFAKAGVAKGSRGGRAVVYEPHFVTDPGAMANGGDASWTKGGQTTWGPNCNNGSGYKMADDFTLAGATTITEIEVYGYQTGSSTTSTFTGLYAAIYDGAPNAGGSIVWGDESANIMTATSFTNCYRGSDGETTATTRPIMAVTATGLNIELPAGTYYLVWSLTGSASSGPWAAPEALPEVGNTGNGLQYTSSGWTNLTDSGAGTTYGAAFKLVGDGGSLPPVPPVEGIIGAYVFRNGELISGIEPLTTTSFVDNGAPAGENEYCVRVVYGGAEDVTYYAMSCPECANVDYECLPVENLTGSYTWNDVNDYGVTLSWDEAVNALYYTVFYSDTVAQSTENTEIFLDLTYNTGVHTFSVIAVYANCESEPVSVDVDVTNVNEFNDNVTLYPNPTNSTVTIEATGMKHITVVNALGQMVYDADLTADMTQLNLGQYKAGIYMVRINTENGISVKRVTVVK